jgi:tetratricopeptide (TPR) repeat protein
LRLDSASGALHYDYGRQLELQGRSDSALYYYRRALALDTTQYRADYRLALAASAHGQRPAALIPHLQRALRRNPRLPGARAILAEALEDQRRLPEALRQYRLLVIENPGNQHWTYKVWKTNDLVQASLPDSLRTAPRTYYHRPSPPPAARPQAVEPLRLVPVR